MLDVGSLLDELQSSLPAEVHSHISKFVSKFVSNRIIVTVARFVSKLIVTVARLVSKLENPLQRRLGTALVTRESHLVP